ELALERADRPALAEDLCGDPLADLALGVAVFQEEVVRVRVHVDEPGRDDQPLGVDFPFGLLRGHAADGDDAIAPDGHVAEEPGVAAAVHDLAIADEQVVRGVRRQGGWRGENWCEGGAKPYGHEAWQGSHRNLPSMSSNDSPAVGLSRDQP